MSLAPAAQKLSSYSVTILGSTLAPSSDNEIMTNPLYDLRNYFKLLSKMGFLATDENKANDILISFDQAHQLEFLHWMLQDDSSMSDQLRQDIINRIYKDIYGTAAPIPKFQDWYKSLQTSNATYTYIRSVVFSTYSADPAAIKTAIDLAFMDGQGRPAKDGDNTYWLAKGTAYTFKEADDAQVPWLYGNSQAGQNDFNAMVSRFLATKNYLMTLDDVAKFKDYLRQYWRVPYSQMETASYCYLHPIHIH